MARYAKLSGKILQLLSNGLLLGYARDRNQKRELLKECDKIWQSIDRNELFHLLRLLRLGKFIILEGDKNIVRLTPKGERRARTYAINQLEIKKLKKWDGKWRIAVFDIPETKKRLRDELRRRLKRLEFVEFQKSVFAHPYPCENEINTLVNFFGLKENVRCLESTLSYDADLRHAFKL